MRRFLPCLAFAALVALAASSPVVAETPARIEMVVRRILLAQGLTSSDGTNAAALGLSSSTARQVAVFGSTDGKQLAASPITHAATGEQAWPTGLGAITHITGPTDTRLQILGGTGQNLNLGASGSASWKIDGTISPIADGTRDLGASGTRVRSGYFGTSVVLGGTATVTGALRELEDVTAGSGAPNVLTLAESGKVLLVSSNASAEVYNTLPDAPTVGTTYTLVVMDADGGRFTANSGDTIRLSTAVSASAGNVSSTTIGSTVTLVAVSATSWVAVAISGTWVVT